MNAGNPFGVFFLSRLLALVFVLPAVLVCSGADGSVRHVFGGQDVELHYEFLSPFDGAIQVEADLYAVTEKLVAPMTGNMALEAEEAPGHGRPQTGTRIAVPIPEVEKVAHLLLLPRARLHESEAWTALSIVRFQVYPRDLLDPLRELTRDEPLFVASESKRLLSWLQHQGIGFQRATRSPDGQLIDKGLILLETSNNETFDFVSTPQPEQVFIIFFEQFSGMPRTNIRPEGAGTIMEVKLPILEKLYEDPSAQETFIEIIERARNHLHTANPHL